MTDALRGDFSRSRAVLVGTWQYTQLKPVDAAKHSLERMRRVLTGPLCGWPTDRVVVVPNPRKPGDIPHTLVTHFADATDVALFYYVGHGQYDYAAELCLALGESSADAIFRRTTSLAYESVRYAFAMSRATTKIAILDCCFAELAAGRQAGRLAAEGFEPPPSPGFYLMMASGEYTTAWFQLPEETPEPQTYFTKYMVDIIEQGIAGAGEGLTLATIFDVVSDKLVVEGKPEPRQRAGNQGGNFIFARNCAIQQRGRDIDVATEVSFRDALTGAAVVVRVPERCASCSGAGLVGEADPCPECQGTGMAQRYRGQTVTLPPGVQDGERLRFERLGSDGREGAAPGDLYVTVHVTAHPLFARDGLNLTARATVSWPELASGTSISLRMPDGNWVAVKVPARSDYGAIVPVPGRGVRTDGRTGDLLVTVEPTGPADAEAAQRLGPLKLQKPFAPAPLATGPVTTYKWSLWRLLGYWSVLAGLTACTVGLYALWAAIPALASFPVYPQFATIVVAGIVIPLHRRLFAWRRPPLRISDDGLEYYRFGFFSWTDIAGVRPSGPGRPWVTVVLRRTTLLSSGRANPQVLPSIILSDLRLNRDDHAERMKTHCPSLVVDDRV